MTPDEAKTIRKRLGLTLRGLADALRISSPDDVRAWERGKKAVSGPVSVCLRYFLKFGPPDKALDPEDR